MQPKLLLLTLVLTSAPGPARAFEPYFHTQIATTKHVDLRDVVREWKEQKVNPGSEAYQEKSVAATILNDLIRAPQKYFEAGVKFELAGPRKEATDNWFSKKLEDEGKPQAAPKITGSRPASRTHKVYGVEFEKEIEIHGDEFVADVIAFYQNPEKTKTPTGIDRRKGLQFRRFQIRGKIHDLRQKVVRWDAAALKVEHKETIPLENTSFQIKVGLAQLKVILEDKKNNIKKVMPIAAGGVVEGTEAGAHNRLPAFDVTPYEKETAKILARVRLQTARRLLDPQGTMKDTELTAALRRPDVQAKLNSEETKQQMEAEISALVAAKTREQEAFCRMFPSGKIEYPAGADKAKRVPVCIVRKPVPKTETNVTFMTPYVQGHVMSVLGPQQKSQDPDSVLSQFSSEALHKPSAFNHMPFMHVIHLQYDKDGKRRFNPSQVGFHWHVDGTGLSRGHRSHGCMRMQPKDLYETFAIVGFGPQREVPIEIVKELADDTDHPYPKQTNIYESRNYYACTDKARCGDSKYETVFVAHPEVLYTLSQTLHGRKTPLEKIAPSPLTDRSEPPVWMEQRTPYSAIAH